MPEETGVQRAPTSSPQPKSGEDELADRIDQHSAWGSWVGGSGSIESYQEIEANVTEAEAPFYRSAEFRTWYFNGWRGLQKLPNPTKALQLVATVLITDQAARSRFFSDIGIGEAGGQIGLIAGKLEQRARRARPARPST